MYAYKIIKLNSFVESFIKWRGGETLKPVYDKY